MDVQIESAVNAVPVANVEPQQTNNTTQTDTTVNEPVNAGNEGVASPQVEKPVQSAEENSKYAQIRREYEQKIATEKTKAIDEYIASQGYSFDGKPITTKAEYDQAVAMNEERERQKALEEKGIDPKIVEEYVNNNPTVKWANEYKSKQEKEQAKQQQFLEFSQTYPDIKGEDIPLDVWTEFNKGVPLKVAYAVHENAKLKAELAEYKKGIKANEANLKNAQSTIGSINSQGNIPVDFITKDVFESNKKDQQWLSKNYDLLKNSMTKW